MPPMVQTSPLAGSGAKRRPVCGEARVERGTGDAGWTRTVSAADFDDVAKVLAEIDDEAGAERFAGEAGAGAARDQRDALFAGVAHQVAHVVLVARHDDAGGLDLEDAGVGAVEDARHVVEEEFALDEALQVVLEPCADPRNSPRQLWLGRVSALPSLLLARSVPADSVRRSSSRTADARRSARRRDSALGNDNRRSRRRPSDTGHRQ